MRKRILAAIAVIAAVTVFLAGCGSAAQRAARAITDEDLITGAIGTSYATRWFEFTVQSIETVPSYAGYTASPGHKLIDVVITERGTFDEPCRMGISDFLIDHDDFEEWYRPLAPLDETMMPESFELAPGEEVQYHMVYEVSDNVSGLWLLYFEEDSNENIGQIFTIDIAD